MSKISHLKCLEILLVKVFQQMKNEQDEDSTIQRRNSLYDQEKSKRKSGLLPFILKWEKETLKTVKSRFFHCSCIIGQYVYLIGGHNDPNNHKDTLSDILVFNTGKFL